MIRFGSSVAYSNLGILVVGAIGDDDGGSARGAVYMFSRDSSGVWSQNTLRYQTTGEVL